MNPCAAKTRVFPMFSVARWIWEHPPSSRAPRIAPTVRAFARPAGSIRATKYLSSSAMPRRGGRAAFSASGAQAPRPDSGDVVALRPSVGRESAASRAHRGAGRAGRRSSPGSDALSAQRSRRRAHVERIPPFSRQAGFSGPLRQLACPAFFFISDRKTGLLRRKSASQ